VDYGRKQEAFSVSLAEGLLEKKLKNNCAVSPRYSIEFPVCPISLQRPILFFPHFLIFTTRHATDSSILYSTKRRSS
jgi:hypothetical protein